MSFSKAKLKRFNEVKACTPSPADYNTVKKSTPKCAVIPQTGRFVDKSPACSESGSTKSSPCFRTPTLPKRKKMAPTTSSKTKLFPAPLNNTGDLEALREKIVECENKDAYIKDMTEQLDEIKDKLLKLELQKTDLDLEKLKYEGNASDLQKEFDQMMVIVQERHDKEIKSLTEEKSKLEADLADLKKEYETFKKEVQEETKNITDSANKCENMYQESITLSNKSIEEKNEIIKTKENELKAFEDSCINLQRKHNEEVEKMQKEHQTQLHKMEFEMLRLMTELEKEKDFAINRIKKIEQDYYEQIMEIKEEHSLERNKLISDHQDEIKQIEENRKECDILKQMQVDESLTEMDKMWQLKLDQQQVESEAILAECQAISEYSIIQCELEKNEALKNLQTATEDSTLLQEKYNVLNHSYEDLNNKYVNVVKNLSKVVDELNETKTRLTNELETKNSELKQALNEKRTYQITISSSQETIQVLKKRLINSDKDVEQLKQEISTSEEKILEYENKLAHLTCELQQTQEYNEELEMQFESTLKINETEIRRIRDGLMKKVEMYEKEVGNYTKKLSNEKGLLNDVWEQLKEQTEINKDAQKLINKIQTHLEDLEKENEEYLLEGEILNKTKDDMNKKNKSQEQEINTLKKTVSQLEEKSDIYYQHCEYYKTKSLEYEKDLEEIGNIHKKYIEQSGRYDVLLQRMDEAEVEHKNQLNNENKKYEELLANFNALQKENEDNKRKIQEQRILIGPFKEQLEAFEMEKDALLGEKKLLEKEAKNVSKKYADILGHQNNKQKIKHLHDLKEKNNELIQEKIDLEKKVKLHSKNNDKLRRELDDLKKYLKKFKTPTNQDKENISSPTRTLNSSRIDSPGPLRDRN